MTDKFAMDDVVCTGSEIDLLHCPHNYSNENCARTEGAGVKCT